MNVIRSFKLAVSVLISAIFATSVLADGSSAGVRLVGTVVGVSDGDTLTLIADGRQSIRVRLAEIDAPEKSQAFGQVAKQSLSDLVYGKAVQVLVVDTDKYGRTVGRVSVSGTDVNLAQVSRGLAWAYTQYVTDPKIPAAEQEARKRQLGLWSDPNPTAPWLFRRGGIAAGVKRTSAAKDIEPLQSMTILLVREASGQLSSSSRLRGATRSEAHLARDGWDRAEGVPAIEGSSQRSR